MALLVLVFVIIWLQKANNPSRRTDNRVNAETQWYEKNIKTKADSEWILDPEIPGNYIPVPGQKNTYMVIDTQGNITAYRLRAKGEDGSWLWTDVENDNKYNVVSETDDGYILAVNDGYVRYLRNEDNSYAYVDCDENGNDTQDTDATNIPDNYVCVTGNVYAVYNEYGVVTGYKERVSDDNGGYVWVSTTKPEITIIPDNNKNDGQSSISEESRPDNSGTVTTEKSTETERNNGDGTSTKISTYTETKQEGNYIVTYKTTVYMTYDASGNLMSTKKEGPEEVSRTYTVINESEDISDVLPVLDEECYRMSSKVNYNTELAGEILDKLNDERAAMGLSGVSMDNGELMKLSKIKCADMAISGYATADSSLYGTLSQAASKYGVPLKNTNESPVMTYASDADTIHIYMQARSNIRENRMSPDINSVAISVVNKNGFTFIYECYR